MSYLELARQRGHNQESHMYWHVDLLYWLTKIYKPQTIVELGTGFGGSFYAFLSGIIENDTGHIYTVDMLDKRNILKEANNRSNLFTIITGNTLEISDIPNIDFLFIDDCHEYEHILKEWDKWIKNVKVGGLIFFHDAIWKGYDVPRAMETIWEKYKSNFTRLYHKGAELNGDHCGLEIWLKIR